MVDSNKEQWFTPEELACRYNVNEGAIRRLLRDGKLKGAKIGRLWRVSQSEWQRYTNVAIIESPQKTTHEKMMAEELNILHDFFKKYPVIKEVLAEFIFAKQETAGIQNLIIDMDMKELIDKLNNRPHTD